MISFTVYVTQSDHIKWLPLCKDNKHIRYIKA
jgi:hypothetical protein